MGRNAPCNIPTRAPPSPSPQTGRGPGRGGLPARKPPQNALKVIVVNVRTIPGMSNNRDDR